MEHVKVVKVRIWIPAIGLTEKYFLSDERIVMSVIVLRTNWYNVANAVLNIYLPRRFLKTVLNVLNNESIPRMKMSSRWNWNAIT